MGKPLDFLKNQANALNRDINYEFSFPPSYEENVSFIYLRSLCSRGVFFKFCIMDCEKRPVVGAVVKWRDQTAITKENYCSVLQEYCKFTTTISCF